MTINKRIKYFTYRGSDDEGQCRNNSPAADTKVDYIVSVLNRIGYGVDVISRAPSAETHYISSSVKIIEENRYKYFASFGCTNAILRLFNRWFMGLQFFLWCLFNIKKKEQVIVYHSLGYDSIFNVLSKIKSFTIIGEVEEIYQDVSPQTKRISRNEYKFINACDKYILPTELLDKKINSLRKPCVIIYGVYSIAHIVENKFSDGKVHVVYGGTLDPNKGGAYAAATAAAFLPRNYHIHICGFGDSSQIKSLIAEVQSQTDAIITFEGEIKGDAYQQFIQKCHIGLSTQNPHAAFNDTSFPSKVLVYMSNNLKVVSARIPVITNSRIVNNVCFYDEQTPQNIAESIILAAEEEHKENDILYHLDQKFYEDLKALIEL